MIAKPRTTIQQKAVSALTTRLPLKFAALFFAVVLWAIVSVEEPTEELVDVQLAPVPTDSNILVRQPLPRVRALVVGRGRDVIRLAAQPPVIRIPITSEAPETLTVRLTPEMVDLPVDVTAIVRDVLPGSAQLRLDVLATRVVPVVSAVRVQQDSGIVVTGEPVMEPDSVTIAGARSLVEAIDSVYTRRVTLRVSDTTARIVALDTARLGVSVRPTRVRVRVPMRVVPPATVALPESGARPPQ